MTKTQFRQKSKILKREVAKLIDERIEKILISGGINLPDHDNDFMLPKAFISACGAEIQFQFRPLSSEMRKVSKNIELHL